MVARPIGSIPLPLFGDIATSYPIIGDFNFKGVWTEGEQVWVWGDRKKLGDLVDCVVSTGRLLRQVQDAKAAGFRFFFVVIEAVFHADLAVAEGLAVVTFL